LKTNMSFDQVISGNALSDEDFRPVLGYLEIRCL